MHAAMTVGFLSVCLAMNTITAFVETQNSRIEGEVLGHIPGNYHDDVIKDYVSNDDDNSDISANDVTLGMLKRSVSRKRYQDISAIHRMKSGPAIGSWYYIMGHSKGAKRSPVAPAAAFYADDIIMTPRQLRHPYLRRLGPSLTANRPPLMPLTGRQHTERDVEASNKNEPGATVSNIHPDVEDTTNSLPEGIELRRNYEGKSSMKKLTDRTDFRGQEKLGGSVNSGEAGIGEILVDLLLKSEH